MNYSKLIHEYLDGDLSPEKEDLLFSGLATSSEFRQEFNSQVKLQIIAQNDMRNISPPLASTSAIFSTLGFSMPSANYLTMHRAPKSQKYHFFNRAFTSLKNIMPNLLTTFIASAITGLILYLLLNGSFSSRMGTLASDIKSSIPVSSFVETTPSAQQSTNQQQDLTWLHDEIDGLKKQLRNNNSYWSNQFSLLAQTIAAGESQQENPAQDSQLASNDQTIPFNSYTTLQDFRPPRNEQLTAGFGTSINYTPIPNNIQVPQDGIDNTTMGLELHGIATISYPSIKINDGSNPWFSNASIGGFYKISKQHTVGLEVGQEKFGMKFNSIENGKEYQYTQNPMLIWYGAYYRYSATDLGWKDRFYPFTQIFAGASSVGPVGKLSVGLEYRLAQNVKLSLGIESKRLWYFLQDNTYTSDKTGVNYGISILY